MKQKNTGNLGTGFNNFLTKVIFSKDEVEIDGKLMKYEGRFFVSGVTPTEKRGVLNLGLHHCVKSIL